MRIVVVTPAVPHPFGNAAARWFYVLIGELVRRGHQVKLLAATEESEQRIREAGGWMDAYSPLLSFTAHRMKVDSFTLRRKWQNFLRPGSEVLQDSCFARQVRREIENGCDVLHLEQMATGWFGVDVPQALLNIHYFDVIDWAARENPTVADRKGLWQARRATKHLLQSVQNVRLLTPRLKQMAQSIYSQGRYSVVPLALDPALYPFQPLVEEPVVGLIGSMNWGPSRSAALRLMTRIWPLIRRSHPTARLLIAGWNARKYLAPHLPSSGVTLADDIADPVEFFSKAAVMVYAPSRGSGMKVKVMEAMAFGVPVVTTWEGMEGFDYQDGTHCWVGETDEKLAEKTTRLLSSLEERRLMRLAARSLIEEKYSPRPIVDQMMNVYEGMNTVTPRTAEESICI